MNCIFNWCYSLSMAYVQNSLRKTNLQYKLTAKLSYSDTVDVHILHGCQLLETILIIISCNCMV
jgi:hypothetical protein